jgi:hypothetical protein
MRRIFTVLRIPNLKIYQGIEITHDKFSVMEIYAIEKETDRFVNCIIMNLQFLLASLYKAFKGKKAT